MAKKAGKQQEVTYLRITRTGEGTYDVLSSSGGSYKVARTSKGWGCMCQARVFCKHLRTALANRDMVVGCMRTVAALTDKSNDATLLGSDGFDAWAGQEEG